MPQKTLFPTPKTFKKDVIKPGPYWPKDKNGEPYRVDVPLGRIEHWVSETKRLLKNGNRVPMPYVHTNDAVPWLEKDPQPGSFNNGGYLKDLRVKEDGTLEIELEAGTEEDAERIGNSVKDVSFRSRDEWTDGHGNKYKDVFTHVALVNHPIVTGQKNFVPTDGLVLSMEMALHGGASVSSDSSHLGNPDEASSGNKLDSLLELLAEHGFQLPENTDETNFTDRLWTALTAVKSFKEQSEGDAERLDEPPQGAKRQQPAPLAMATDQELQFAVETLSAGTENPSTKAPWTVDELKAAHAAKEASKPKIEFTAEQNAQLAAIQYQAKLPLVQRIRDLMAKHIVSPEKAEAELMPLVKTTELQFSQEAEKLGHVIEDTPIHIILSTLEKLSPGTALHNQVQDSVSLEGLELSLDSGLTVQDRPREWEKGESKEDNTKTADRMASYIS